MVRALCAVLLFVLGAAAAGAATAPAELVTVAACEPGKLPAPGEIATPCEVEGDVTAIAAELLVVKFGADAPAFATVRERRYDGEDDPKSAKFWHDISVTAAEILKSRGIDVSVPTILSK
jgi:hypothetical protein